MNELIRISETKVGNDLIQTVNAKELHAYLGSRQDFSHWIKSRISAFGFTQDIDFIDDKIIVSVAWQDEPVIKSVEYYISIDMAKELSMVERNEKGREIRKYFIKCERLAKSVVATPALPANFVEALELLIVSEKSKLLLVEKIEIDRPLVEFATAVSECKGCTISEFAKLLNIKGIGRNNMFKKLVELGYLMSNKEPYQRYINSGLFERIELAPYKTSLGTYPTFKTLITGKGQIAVEKVLRAELSEAA